MLTESVLDTLVQRMVSPSATDTKGGVEGDNSQMPTPPQTPITPPPLCLLSPSTSSESRETEPLEGIQQLSQDAEVPSTVVSLSTSFHPAADHCGGLAPDLVLLSADSVFFYVHSAVISSASSNNLCGLLTSTNLRSPQASDQGTTTPDGGIELVMLPDQSQVLNIMLHFIYNISPAHHSPPFHVISQAVDRLNGAYGVEVNRVIQGSILEITSPHPSTVQAYNQPNNSPLFTFLESHAPLYPIELYALAASIDCYPLAQTASLYLHGLDICPTDDKESSSGKLRLAPEMARKIGGLYLMRLAGVHKRRLEVLRTAVCIAPEGHLIDRPFGDQCSVEDQASLKRAWALAAAYIVCTAGPGISAHEIEGVFRPLAQHIACSRCRGALDKRLELMKTEWAMAPRTI
ncbi:hypothetical protein BDN71DRAFT_762921 [Pleurotus eryngii]|uniref:BTB domain-containing protein n=1 Tax=Pleurotus eryngii TaxID=5323 RepID=A0A9P6D7X3_PLEER|nr:hypothetical protein BDN71DRAFT_762921 [Pleurotus eryngii]